MGITVSTTSKTDDDATIWDQVALYVTVGAAVLAFVCTIWLAIDDGASFAESARSFFVWVTMAGGVVMGLLYLRRVIARRSANS